MKKKKESLIRKSMRISIEEGTYAQVFSSLVSIGNSFITKYAILLKASPIHFSIIASIAQLSQLFQLIGIIISRNAKQLKHKTVFYAFAGRALNILLFIPLLILNPALALGVFIFILLISAGLQNISGNMWTAWIASLIPKQIRGRFFSRRMQILMFFGLIIGYFFSFIIDLFETNPDSWKYPILKNLNLTGLFIKDHQIYGVYLVFLIGTLIGLYGLRILNRQPEKAINKEESNETLSLFEPFKNNNFRKLAFFNIWWMFAIGIGAPFWGPFMMKKLQMSMLEIQIYTTIQTITMLMAFRFWGKFIDRFGNRTTMKICIFLGSINSFVWIFFRPDAYSFIWFESILSGFMWSGTNIVTMNFVLSVCPKGKEQIWSGMYSSLGGLMMMSTMLMSGLFFPSPMKIWGLNLEPEQVLFGLTGIIRMTAEIPLHYVQEPSGVSFRKTVRIIQQSLMRRFERFMDN